MLWLRQLSTVCTREYLEVLSPIHRNKRGVSLVRPATQLKFIPLTISHHLLFSITKRSFMNIIGIISEYNPFHNGHAYQISEIRRRTGAQFIVAAMSGDFVQRGAPAIIDKYARSRMALNCGVDLVVELPVLWATSSAESFAMAGVTLFEKMGCVDGICFGAESDNLPLLSAIAGLLAAEPDVYKASLAAHLKREFHFPKARAQALYDCLSSGLPVSATADAPAFLQYQSDEIIEAVSSPNNILAIEYLKALIRRKSKISPLLLKRKGAGYHDDSISAANASATAIRKLLSDDAKAPLSSNILSILAKTIPEEALPVLASCLKQQSLLQADDFSSILGYQLLCHATDGYTQFADTSQDISNRLKKNLFSFQSFRQFCEKNKSRDITYTRMSRILTHLLLNLTEDDYLAAKALDYTPYLRVLGFRKDSAALLGTLKSTSSIPVISKLADASGYLSAGALTLLQKDIFAADLYEQIKAEKLYQNTKPAKRNEPQELRLPSEYARKIVIV